jgi:hypothetical protein
VWTHIEHHHRDWDNIPPVVPQYCIQLSKYMEGVLKILKEQHDLETVISLRNFTELQLKSNDERLTRGVRETMQVK